MKISNKIGITYIVVLFISTSSFSQDIGAERGVPQIHAFGQLGASTTKNNLGDENINLVRAKIYYYPTYNNTGSIITTTGRKYSITNINFNIYSNNFDSKMSADSIYVFDNNQIKSVKINNRIFKTYFNSEVSRNRMYEVIYESDNVTLLRKDKMVYTEVRDPLNVNKPKINYKKEVNYYVKKADNLKKIVLKKKSMLKLFNDEKNMVADYAKKNNLSFKNERDVSMILKYYNSL